MATQMQQPLNNRFERIATRAVSIVGMAGLIAVGISLLGTPTQPATLAPQPVIVAAPLGIDAPTGVNLAELPAGYRDYIRTSSVGLPQATNPELGIDLPPGATWSNLPVGLREYIRFDWRKTSIPAGYATLGVDLPSGVNLTDLPIGYREYIRVHETPRVAPTNPDLGIDIPTGVDLATLPAGYTDYFRR